MNTKSNGKKDNKRGSKGKYYPKGRFKKDKRTNEELKEDVGKQITKDINDISYYVTDPTVLAQACNFSFRDFAGVEGHMGPAPFGVPNIMRVEVSPCIPYSNAEHANTDGFNMAMYGVFLEQIKDNKRAITYGPEDIGMPVLATGSILALASTIERIFGYISCYNPRNRLWPRQVLKSLGVTEDDITHLADLRVKYNSTVVPMFNKLPMYAGFPYFSKCYNMFRNIYTDQDGSPMSQIYYLDLSCIWKYNDTATPEGAGLDTIFIFEDYNPGAPTNPKVPMSLTHRIDLMIELTQALMTSTAMLTIQADLMRYAEGHNKSLVSLAPISEALASVPTHSAELDDWLDNATFVPLSWDPSATSYAPGHTTLNNVVPDINTHACVYRPIFDYVSLDDDTVGIAAHALLNFWVDNPTVEQKVYATRMCALMDLTFVGTSPNKHAIPLDIACCDWVVNRLRFVKNYGSYEWDEDPFINLSPTNGYVLESDETTTLSDLIVCGTFSQFDHHPRRYIIKTTQGNPSVISIIGDLQYYTDIDIATLKSIHDVCALGLWRL